MKIVTGEVLLLRARIAELEAENAELRKAGLSSAPPTREQIAALVKPLEWKEDAPWRELVAMSIFGEYRHSAPGFKGGYHFAELTHSERSLWRNDNLGLSSEARAAAEAHHRETVLSLLNLPA